MSNGEKQSGRLRFSNRLYVLNHVTECGLTIINNIYHDKKVLFCQVRAYIVELIPQNITIREQC